eukprot:g6541.t1
MYKKSKGEAERQVLAANDPQNLCTVSLRPGHLFGPGDLLPDTVTGFPVAIGDVTRSKMSFTYIENAALAHLECFRYMKTQRLLDGKPAFITDFEINFFVAYYSITRKKLPLLWIPTEIFWVLLLLVEFVTRIVFSIIPLRFNPIHKITGLNTASIESGVVLTASNSKARQTFDYLSANQALLADHVSKAKSLCAVLSISMDVAKVLLKEYEGNVELAAHEVMQQRRFGVTLGGERYETRKSVQTEKDVSKALIRKVEDQKVEEEEEEKVPFCGLQNLQTKIPSFKTNDRVYAQSDIESEWKEATIVKVNEDSTFHVTWKDGSQNRQLHRDLMRTLKAGVGRIVSKTKLRLVCPSVSKENDKNVWPMEGEVTFAYFKESFDRYPTRRKIQAKVVFSPGVVVPKKRKKKKKKTTTKGKKTTKKGTKRKIATTTTTTTTTTKTKRKRKSKHVKEKNNAKNIYTEFDGVSIHSSTKWRSKIRLLENAKHLQLGFHDTQEEAALIYDITALKSRDLRYLWDLRRNWNPPVLTNFAGENVIITEQEEEKKEEKKLSEWQTKAMQALNLDTTKMVFADISKVNRVVPTQVLATLKEKWDEPETRRNKKHNPKRLTGYSLFCKTKYAETKKRVMEVEKKDSREVFRDLGDQWNKLSQAQRDEWQRKVFILHKANGEKESEILKEFPLLPLEEGEVTEETTKSEDKIAPVPVPVIVPPTPPSSK